MHANRAVRIGLIGAGRIGQLHAEHLAYRIPQAELRAISDVYRPAADALALRLNVSDVYEEQTQILEDPNIEAVVICSSTDTHSLFIEQAAAAGKHIFCEKPIDFDLAKIDRALKAVEQAGVKLQIGFNRRFDPNFSHAHNVIASGQIGTPQLLRITSRDPSPPPLEYIKVSGGLFLDMTIHDFDMARYLMQSEVVEIFALGEVLVDPQIGQAEDIDTAVITLKFEHGAIGGIDNSRKAVYGYDQRAEVLGSKGMIMAENPLPHQTQLAREEGFSTPPLMGFFMERYTESYIQEMTEFIACVQQDQAPSVTGIDGRLPVVMGLAAKKSLKERRPVRLSEID